MAEELWEIALSRLKESDGDAAAVLLQPDGSVGSGVVGLIEDIERKRRAREEEGGWTVTLPGTRRDGKKRVLSVRRAVYSILEAAFEYKDIVDKVLAFDPTRYGAIAWSVVSFGINMALNGKHHFEEACEGAKLVAHELRKYGRICAQYLRKSTTGREDLKDSIIDAYVSLLRYCAELRSLEDPGLLARAWRNLGNQNPLEPFQKQYQEADAHVHECIERVSHESLDDDFTVVKDKLQVIKRLAMESGRASVAMEQFLKESARDQVLQWVFPTWETGHTAIRNKLQDDVKAVAGRWLLQTPDFKEWEEEKGPAGLRLEGEAGTGKTILTSTVIEYIRSKYGVTGATGIPVGVFYCSGVRDSYESTEAASHADSAAVDIIRSLLRQFGQTSEGFQVLEAEYRVYHRTAAGVSPLQLTDAKRLLRSLVQMHDMSFIILDALDECLAVGQDKERLNVMELFNDLLEDDAPVKIFVSSRFEPDIQDYMGEWKSIKLTKTSTRADLSTFVDLTIDRKLRRKRNCSEELKYALKTRLKHRAEGNFRWAQVSLEYICEPTRPALDLLSVLEQIPRKLNDFYFKLLSEVKEDNSDFNRAIGLRSIALLLATTDLRMGLKTKEFLGIVLADMGGESVGRNIGIDDIRVACHHLVVLDEIADAFEFGHFSVAEFFHADKRTNKHYEDISRDFGSRALWRQVSAMCASRILTVPNTTQTAEDRLYAYIYPDAAKIYWGLFAHSLKESCQSSPTLPKARLGYVRPDLSDGGDRDRPVQPTKVCIVGTGISYPFGFGINTISFGRSFVEVDGLIKPWFRGPQQGWGSTEATRSVSQVDPSCRIYVAKVCENLSDKTQADNISHIATSQAIRWAIHREVDVVYVYVSGQASESSQKFREAIKTAMANDIMLVFNAQTSTSLGPATYYRFQGDKSIEDTIRCTGAGTNLYGSAFLAGVISLFISQYRQVHGKLPPAGKRQAVKEWLHGLAQGDVGGEDVPWAIVEEAALHEDGHHLEAAVI